MALPIMRRGISPASPDDACHAWCSYRDRRPAAFAALALAVIILSGACGSTSTTYLGPTPVQCEIGLSFPPNSIPSGGGAGVVMVTAAPECAWTASENVSWISQLSPTSGQGSGEVAFQAAGNTGSTSRQGEVAVNGVT